MKSLYIFGISLIVLALLGACGPSAGVVAGAVNETLIAMPTQTAFPTYTPNPTYTQIATNTPYPTFTPAPTQTARVIIITPTETYTPEFTPTITQTPTNTPTITPTQDKLKTDKGSGFYLVGIDIAPGVWRSNGTADDCYWEVSSTTGDIIDNHFGMSGGTMYIPISAFQVELDPECGSWTFLSNP